MAGSGAVLEMTAPALRARKQRGETLVMVTAYDAPGARIASAAGVDLILVGDSVANTVLGYEDTLQVTVDDMAHHVAAVHRGGPSAMVVADLPWLSYHTGPVDAVRNAARLIRAGAAAVKLEGGRKRLPVIDALVDTEIPVMGHLGLTPQSVHAMGGYRVQARQAQDAADLLADAVALAEAGCFAVVLEGVPESVARVVTETIPVPTIGIGAGPHCDGQVLVFHDVLGFDDRIAPKFVRRYATLKADATAALEAWVGDVRNGRFPVRRRELPLPRGRHPPHDDCGRRPAAGGLRLTPAPVYRVGGGEHFSGYPKQPRRQPPMSSSDEAKGRAKEAAGALTDKDDLKKEGKSDQAKGKAGEAVDKVTGKVDDAADRLKDKIKDR